ncbi:MAG: hypothetical protein ACPGVU_10650 [Limisphaerales bacterium]
MFASAAREVVFSNPAAVRLIQRDFIPVALKAALVNNPPSGPEGRFYAEISRSKPAPQGICVANSDGKALAWALSFNDDGQIPKFLQHAQSLYQESPDASRPVTTERYMQFPGNRLSDVADTRPSMPALAHGNERCPGKPAVEKGTLVGRIIGRALDENGLPLADTLRQEHYLEARVQIAPPLQRELTRAAQGADEFALPEAFVRTLVEPAYLGQLDVNPLAPNPGGVSERFEAVMVAKKHDTESGIRLQITGESDIAGGQQKGRSAPGDGRQWEHRVTLGWEGFIDIKGDQITRIVMLANGRERLRWGHRGLFNTREPAAAHLMAGHAIKLNCGARYGLICEPAPDHEVVSRARVQSIARGPQRRQNIRTKVERVQAGIRRHQAAKRDLAPVSALMKQFGPLMRKQQFGKAEAILDRTLKLLESGESGTE